MSLDEDREKRERGAARSLLQKAVRRGSPLAVEQAARFLLAQGDRTWLRMRTVVILFEECWPMASDLVLPRDPEELIRLLSRIALTRKHKDAAGLGALAHDYHGGERGMLSFTEDDSELRLVAEAMKRPQDFFGWALKTAKGDDARSVISFAVKHLSCATWPWDKACVLAGAFFAATQGVPSLAAAPQLEGDFPIGLRSTSTRRLGAMRCSSSARRSASTTNRSRLVPSTSKARLRTVAVHPRSGSMMMQRGRSPRLDSAWTMPGRSGRGFDLR